jgi:PilZ domain
MANERRRYPRYEIIAQVTIRSGGENYLMDVGNISCSGVFISADNLDSISFLYEGQDLEMDLFTTEYLENIKVKGRVVRFEYGADGEKKGFGVKFAKATSKDNDELLRLVNMAAESIHPPPLPGRGFQES